MNVLFYIPVPGGEVKERIYGVVEIVAQRVKTALGYTPCGSLKALLPEF